jgi:UDP-N-acetylglucosamine 2-epimerase (hydrolysing)
LQFEGFLAVLRNAKFMLGNSSAGVREAPAFGVPSINVGSRQRGRYECPGIADVPEDRQAILDALKNPPQAEPDNHFGEGQAALKFMEALASQTFWEIPVQK